MVRRAWGGGGGVARFGELPKDFVVVFTRRLAIGVGIDVDDASSIITQFDLVMLKQLL